MNTAEPPVDVAREWLERAKSSFEMASSAPRTVFPEERCYALQQSAEKAIKAVYIANSLSFPYTHDISLLLRRLSHHGITVPEEIKPSISLTPYATITRYPGYPIKISEDNYQKAFQITEKVIAWAEKVIISE